MNTYVTGATIKQLREMRNMTQTELAEKLCVSSKSPPPSVIQILLQKHRKKSSTLTLRNIEGLKLVFLLVPLPSLPL